MTQTSSFKATTHQGIQIYSGYALIPKKDNFCGVFFITLGVTWILYNVLVYDPRSRMTQELDRKAFEIFWKSETSKDIKK